MNIKYIVILLLVILAILITSVVATSGMRIDLYEDAEHVNYKQVLNNNEPTVYYYYQSTCGFCNSIKDQVKSLYLATHETEGIDMKLIDMKADENINAWGDGEYDPLTADMTNVEDIKITGTPSMIYVVDGEVTSYKTGLGVFDIMEDVNDEFNLDLTFDRSRYGE